jgi:predicted nucleic acid-binding protein
MADFLLDSDVVIWHLRGHSSIADRVLSLAHHGRIGLSAVARAEVLQGMREPERKATLGFLDATALLAGLPLYTCNPRHYPIEGLDLRALST